MKARRKTCVGNSYAYMSRLKLSALDDEYSSWEELSMEINVAPKFCPQYINKMPECAAKLHQHIEGLLILDKFNLV